MHRLIIGQQHGCLPYVIAIVSALSVGDPFIQDYHLDENQPEDSDDEGDINRRELQNITSESVAEKERRKLVRKKYYTSQMVNACTFIFYSHLSFKTFFFYRNMLVWTPPVTF